MGVLVNKGKPVAVLFGSKVDPSALKVVPEYKNSETENKYDRYISSQWLYISPTGNTFIREWRIEQGHCYVLFTGYKMLGNRFRCAFFESDVFEATSDMSGTYQTDGQKDYGRQTWFILPDFFAGGDGKYNYLAVGLDNTKKNIPAFLIDITDL